MEAYYYTDDEEKLVFYFREVNKFESSPEITTTTITTTTTTTIKTTTVKKTTSGQLATVAPSNPIQVPLWTVPITALCTMLIIACGFLLCKL